MAATVYAIARTEPQTPMALSPEIFEINFVDRCAKSHPFDT